MAHILVKIAVNGTAAEVRNQIAAAQANPNDPAGHDWCSAEDGPTRVLIDDLLLERSNADDSFFAMEFVGVEE